MRSVHGWSITAGIEAKWRAAGLPINETADVARIVAGVACDDEQNGKAFYLEGGRAWEIEDNINRLEPEWLGQEQSMSLAKGQEVLGAARTRFSMACFGIGLTRISSRGRIGPSSHKNSSWPLDEEAVVSRWKRYWQVYSHPLFHLSNPFFCTLVQAKWTSGDLEGYLCRLKPMLEYSAAFRGSSH
jgi:hypothetical protein